jgi:hypothetical protein
VGGAELEGDLDIRFVMAKNEHERLAIPEARVVGALDLDLELPGVGGKDNPAANRHGHPNDGVHIGHCGNFGYLELGGEAHGATRFS